MLKWERKIMNFSICLAMVFGVTQSASAMHIMEGYLPVGHSFAWMAISLPFVTAGLLSIRKIVEEHRRTLLLLAMAGAYTFVLSALKIPSVTGSSSHPTGTGLGAILFGPTPMAVLGLIVLLFQALLLAHGGITTLGANTFSMAIAGPFVTFWVYKLCRKLKIKPLVAVFLGSALGSMATYCVTSLQLGIAYPSAVGGTWASVIKFLGVFAVTQLPLAVIEGIFTAVVVMGLESFAKPELRQLGYFKGGVS